MSNFKLAAVAGLGFLAAVSLAVKKDAGTAAYAEPEAGAVHDNAYVNDYFGLRYPLPSGWVQDLQGPPPSISGYYSLADLKPSGDMTAAMLIAAQDNFFAPEPIRSAMDFVVAMKNALDPSLEAPQAPSSVQISGRTFARFSYSGAALYHAVYAAEVRCHTVIFSMTSGDPEKVEKLAASLNGISFSAAQNAQWPVCIANYATGDQVVRRVSPAMAGPRFSSVPARVIVGKDGRVEHVHAIAGFPEQLKSVTEALQQWQFKPYSLNGVPVEVETGILVQFGQKPAE
jgi:hypothetical protein